MSDQNSTNGSAVLHQDSQGPPAMEPYRHLTDRALAELHARASLRQDDPDQTRRAEALVAQGRIDRTGPDSYEVIGSQGTIYTIIAGKCSCEARTTPGAQFACYHRYAVALYGWVEKALQEEGHAMFAEEEETVQDSAIGQKTAQDGPQDTNVTQDDLEHVHQSGGLVEASSGQNEAQQEDTGETEAQRLQRYIHYLEAEIEKRDGWADQAMVQQCAHEEALTRREMALQREHEHAVGRACDLTPIPLPGGGERTRTIGQLMRALACAQQRMKNPAFDKQGQVGNLKTRFASTPAMRNEIVPALAAVDIAILQYVYQTEDGMRCMTTLGHGSGEYVCVPLDVPHSGTTLNDRGKTVGFVKRWALQTAVVLFGDDEAEGMEDLPKDTTRRTESAASSRQIPDMTASMPPRKTTAALRQAIEELAKQQQRSVEYVWSAAERKFGVQRDALSVEHLEQMVKGLIEKGAA